MLYLIEHRFPEMADKIFRIHVGWYFLPNAWNCVFHWQHTVSPPFCILGVNRYLDPVVVYATYLRFPSRPNKISVEQRGSEENAETGSVTRLEQHPNVSSYEIHFRKNVYSKSQAGERNCIRINSITSACDALHVNECAIALSNFRVSHISRWRRQSARSSSAVAVSALIFVTSRILFSNGGVLHRAIDGR